jgi:hypothetical protein
MYDSFSSFFQPILPTVEHLYVIDGYALRHWQREIEKSELPELLHPFTAVKNLYSSREIVPYIMLSLQELLGERMTEVLPTLQKRRSGKE